MPTLWMTGFIAAALLLGLFYALLTLLKGSIVYRDTQRLP